MYYKGKYTPKNPKKYIGNPSEIIYRSLWELKFMKYCDLTTNISEWSSEPFAIPYLCPTDKKKHKYFPDFYIKVNELNGTTHKYVIEIKPEKQTKPPKKRKKTKNYLYEQLTYIKNIAKWKHAKQYCKKRNWKFKILTENEIQPYK
tara:strand:- start:2141 stop:2578 length:438 start_codon:yes stop_codon:yes gene_type:complete